MSIRPVFFLVVSISAPMHHKHKSFKLFIPLPLFCFNDFIESIADLAAFLNLITFGFLKVKVFEPEDKRPSKVGIKAFAAAAYAFSDVITELSLFTGGFDLVNVDVADGAERSKVKIFTF